MKLTYNNVPCTRHFRRFVKSMLNMDREVLIVLQLAIMLLFVRFSARIDDKLANFLLHVAVAEARYNQIKVFLFNLANFCLRHLSNFKL